MSYDSKYSGAVAEQMLDDYVGGKLDGGGAKVYDFNMELALQLGAIGQEVYDAIMDADIVTSDDGSLILSKYPSSDGSIKLFGSSIELIDEDDSQRLMAASVVCTIGADLSVTAQMLTGLIPTKTSELTNDSGFITAEESPKIYHMAALAGESGTVSQEVYDAILAADVVVYSNRVADVFKKSDGSCNINCIHTFGATVINDGVTITQDLTYTFTQRYYTIPTATSELTNDSGFITAADLPPSGGMPTEVIELSSEITLQEGKMLEIDSQTAVEGALTIKRPTTVNGSQGLLWGIRFFCGQTVPQLTFRLGIVPLWMNGELPQLEPNVLVEIIGAVTFDGYAIMSWAKYK